MSVIKGFIYKHRRGITLIVLILVSFLLMIFSNNKVLKSSRNILSTIVYPFQYSFNSIGGFVQNTFNSIGQLKRIKKDRDALRIEIEKYKRAVVDFAELNRENKELKQLLHLKNTISYKSVSCEVISGDPERLYNMIILNKGSNNGIKINMPVITYSNGKKVLVGKIVEVNPFYSKVMTLHNSDLLVGGIISSNSVHGLIHGDNSQLGIIKLLYLPKSYNNQSYNNSIVYTSGDSLIYPRGIEIGRIIKIIPSKRYEIFNEADVKLSVDFSKLEYAMVLLVDSDIDNYKLMEIQE